jgi:hypothetical protein
MPADLVRYDTERGRRGSTLLIALGVDLIVVVAVAVLVPGRRRCSNAIGAETIRAG